MSCAIPNQLPLGVQGRSHSFRNRIVADPFMNCIPISRITATLVLLLSLQPSHGQPALAFSFDEYEVAIRFDAPFGIVSLKSKGQVNDFAHLAATDEPSFLPFPLGEWEWFWLEFFSEDKQPEDNPIREKVMVTPWPRPVIRGKGVWTVLNFEKPNVLEPGITLKQDYYLNTLAPEFAVHYVIRNNTRNWLRGPYVMVGFPGFMNHRAVVAVETSTARHTPDEAFSSYFDESTARGLYEYPLIRHDVFPRSHIEELRGSVTIEEPGKQFILTSTFTPNETMKHVYSAHTNKQLYLTSHLYVFFRDIPPGQSRTVVVHNAIHAVDVETTISGDTWGGLKEDYLQAPPAPGR